MAYERSQQGFSGRLDSVIRSSDKIGTRLQLRFEKMIRSVYCIPRISRQRHKTCPVPRLTKGVRVHHTMTTYELSEDETSESRVLHGDRSTCYACKARSFRTASAHDGCVNGFSGDHQKGHRPLSHNYLGFRNCISRLVHNNEGFT